MKTTLYGTYPARQMSRGETMIHFPKKATGKFAIYANDDFSVIVYRKQLPFRDEKFIEEMDKAVAGESIPWVNAKKYI